VIWDSFFTFLISFLRVLALLLEASYYLTMDSYFDLKLANINYLVFFYQTLQLYLPPKDSENYSIT